ncbi:MAG: NTP transferase domain-containing protein [Actinobacteria bacterium]|nr:NTP transferase domain-containing protein [Actinomycetota bacterium]
MTGTSAIVLAAGRSSRMGGFKPLADLGGRTLLARAVAAFAAIGVEDVVVVTGHRGGEVAAAAGLLGARPVANPRFDRGMYTSVQAGVAAVGAGRRFFLLPVDCPLVRPETLGKLARAGAAADAGMTVPVFEGRPGHPPLLGPALREEILAADPPGGLRALLAGRQEPALEVAVDDPGVAHDADLREDLERLRDLAAGEDLPSERRCLDLLDEAGASPDRVAHSLAVAAVAGALAAALNERGQCLCVPLVTAAALLHDIAREEPRHWEVGARLLEGLGYRRVAPLVLRHMRLGDGERDDLDEAQVVFLADKLVLGDRIVGLEARFAARAERFTGDPGALTGVRARLEEARRVQARVEAVLERPLTAALRV